MAFFLPYHPVALTSHPIFTGACSNTGLPMTTPTPTLTRPQLMARLAGERGHLLWAITALSETTLSEGLLHGEWHVKDLFPHIGQTDPGLHPGTRDSHYAQSAGRVVGGSGTAHG